MTRGGITVLVRAARINVVPLKGALKFTGRSPPSPLLSLTYLCIDRVQVEPSRCVPPLPCRALQLQATCNSVKPSNMTAYCREDAEEVKDEAELLDE